MPSKLKIYLFSCPTFACPLIALIGMTLGSLLLSGCGTNSQPVMLSAQSYNFGQTAIHTSVRRTILTLTNASNQSATIKMGFRKNASFSLNRGLSCPQSLPAQSSCSIVMTFTPQQTGAASTTLRVRQLGHNTQKITLTGTGLALSAGEGIVTATNNPLVALYSYAPQAQGTVVVNFGPTTSYGYQTSAVATPINGDPVTIYVAGMQANTTYHMQATLTASDGTVYHDTDQTFTTSNFPAAILPSLVASTTSGATPQPGIEMVDATLGNTLGYLEAYATDLAGNLIWGYNFGDRSNGSNFATIVQPIKPLPNGNFLVVLSYASQDLLDSSDNVVTPPEGTTDLIREIDLAGNPVRQLTMAQLNTKLAAAGYNLTLYDFHHDITVLPNGHWIVIANTVEQESGVEGESGTQNVLGDVLVDLDTNLKPVWVWNEFDHLDINRHPMSYPDWTHTNAILYSPSDGDLLISIRHQNWLLKIDYENGHGSGDIVWHLGEGGDFTLKNGSDPIDWFYAQHGPSWITSNTSGNFEIAVMDNGDDRIDAGGNVCGASTFACYTTVPIFDVDENAKTATLVFHDVLPAADYSNWGGYTTALSNGDLEFDLCSGPETASGDYTSTVEEVTRTATPQVVWKMQATGENFYRATRMPSLYPGVSWPTSAPNSSTPGS